MKRVEGLGRPEKLDGYSKITDRNLFGKDWGRTLGSKWKTE